MCECVFVSVCVCFIHYQAVILLHKKNTLFWTIYQRSGKQYDCFFSIRAK